MEYPRQVMTHTKYYYCCELFAQQTQVSRETFLCAQFYRQNIVLSTQFYSTTVSGVHSQICKTVFCVLSLYMHSRFLYLSQRCFVYSYLHVLCTHIYMFCVLIFICTTLFYVLSIFMHNTVLCTQYLHATHCFVYSVLF